MIARIQQTIVFLILAGLFAWIEQGQTECSSPVLGEAGFATSGFAKDHGQAVRAELLEHVAFWDRLEVLVVPAFRACFVPDAHHA